MSATPSNGGPQRAVIFTAIGLIAAMIGLTSFLLSGAGAAGLPPATASPQASETQTPSPLPSLTASPTPEPSVTPSPSPTITPTPLPPAACLPVNAAREEAEVVAVLSANTIEVKTTGSRYFVRYLGVDLVGDGLAGLALNRTLVEGKIVTLIGDATDGGEPEYRLRYVMSGDIFVNYALVRQGTAMTALFPSIPECMDVFLAGEALAKSELAGFWGLQGATSLPPGVGTLAPACDCKVRYACTDFASQSDAQACYNACGDYRNSSLDPDHNGLACDE